jgi:hypothetical protein
VCVTVKCVVQGHVRDGEVYATQGRYVCALHVKCMLYKVAMCVTVKYMLYRVVIYCVTVKCMLYRVVIYFVRA